MAKIECTVIATGRCNPRRLPIDSRHAGEFARVCGHEKRVTLARLCRDENIVRADGRSRTLQRGADIA
jgi:hypothetical protein